MSQSQGQVEEARQDGPLASAAQRPPKMRR
jgi:hypothetical protein